jgi:hypothetical protein
MPKAGEPIPPPKGDVGKPMPTGGKQTSQSIQTVPQSVAAPALDLAPAAPRTTATETREPF